MKKFVSGVLTVVLLSFAACKNTGISTPDVAVINTSPSFNNPDAPPPGTPVLETPQQYNNYIIERRKKLQECIEQIQAAETMAADISASSNEPVQQINRLTAEIKAMPPYKGSDALQNTAVALFEFYETTYSQYTIAHKLSGTKKPMANELSIVEKKLDAAFQVQQQMFADANHFVLVNTTIQPRVDYLN